MPGFKNFLENQILTAENFMDYIAKQCVIVCDTESDRDTSLAAHVREGMTCYCKDVDQMFVYVIDGWERIAVYSEAISSYDPRDNQITIGMSL